MNRHEWDPDNKLDTFKAKQVFSHFQTKGYLAETDDGQILSEFNPHLGIMTFVRPPSRYDILRGDGDTFPVNLKERTTDNGNENPELGR